MGHVVFIKGNVVCNSFASFAKSYNLDVGSFSLATFIKSLQIAKTLVHCVSASSALIPLTYFFCDSGETSSDYLMDGVFSSCKLF